MEALLKLCVITVICGCIHGARILLMPAAGPSHIAQGSSIGKALLDKGHDVYMVLPSSYPLLEQHTKGPFKLLTNHHIEKDMFSYNLSEIIEQSIGLTVLQTMMMNLPGGLEMCTNFLSDNVLYDKIKKLNFDLWIIDGLPFSHCGYIMPYRLGTPYISYVTVYSTSWMRNPSLPSHVPTAFGRPYSEKMSFWERLDNLYTYLQHAWHDIPYYNTIELVKKFAPEMPPVSMDTLIRRNLLWLIDNDPVIDYPRAVMPNEILIGGMTTRPASPLPQDLQALLTSAKAVEHGVIVLSFGSGAPDIKSEVFLQVFSRIPQIVVWRHMSDYKGSTPVPGNVHMLKWLPQADLLGHNSTRLFLTHCGANGQFEALYHAVPMIGFPIMAEQAYNAKRMEYHGFGRTLNILTFTEYDLYEAIHDLLTNPKYKENIAKASAIYRSRPSSPIERATYWIEHVLEYGADHLMSYGLQMPWYSFWMLDIFLFISAVLFSALLFLCGCLRLCCRKSKANKHKAE